ncbi:MAG: CoA transferase [Proteobacteria bacterium]|nr:CoA transferase [Pseudomonadota bacterium]
MDDKNKPLHNIKVVSLALNLPGPAAAQKLKSLGASVTKIEPPDGDPFEKMSSRWYEVLCTGQNVMRLDLKNLRDRETFESLMKECDIFLTSSRPSALDRLSLGWADIHSRYPKLCQVAIVGYPAPDQNKAGHDLTYMAAVGLLLPPNMPLTFLADLAGAERAVSSALALLYVRERGNGSGYAEVALSESAENFAVPLRYGLTIPGGLLGGALPQYNLYETRNGWIAVAALEDHFLNRFAKELGLQVTGIKYEELMEIFITKTALEWEAWAISLDLPIAAVH